MNVIDHAILIPASPEFIWRFLGDVSQNSNWQEDCNDISFLTTQHEGRGTRWRYTTPKGKDVIVEISAWYDTLGYEYRIVEGSSVNENQGRIRLQEIAEGTLVQWTFNYELEGMLGGLRNSIGLKRTLTNNIQDSLRNLYKLVQQETGGISTHEARALLQEAPAVEERENYQPRYPSNFTEDSDSNIFKESQYPSETSIAYQAEQEGIVEPPVADDDTKPNPVVQGTDEIEAVNSSSGSLEHQITEPPLTDDDTKPNAPIEKIEAIEPNSTEDDIIQLPAVESTIEEKDEEIQDNIKSETETPSEVVATNLTPDIRDTSRISVFEVFGLQKPSETQELSAITDEDIVKMAENEDSKLATLESDVVQIDEPAELDDTDDNISKSPEIEDNKRGTIESGVIHVDEPIETNEDDHLSSIPTDQPALPQIADTPETVVPDAIVDEPMNIAETSVVSAQYTSVESKSVKGLRFILRQKVINLRPRK